MENDFNDGYIPVDCKLYPGKQCTTHFEPCFMDYIANRFWRKKVLAVIEKPQQPEYKSVYELTLTTIKDDPYELRQFIGKVARSVMFEVVDMPYCIELTEAGIPHIHALVYSKKRSIDASQIKKLGFPYRYECKRVKSLPAYRNYIMKEKDNPIIVDYCLKKRY